MNKKEEQIRASIDESLSGVRFNAHDRRAVMQAIHGSEKEAPQKRRLRLDVVFTALLLVLLASPVALITLHRPTFSTAPGSETSSPAETPLSRSEDIILPAAALQRSIPHPDAVPAGSPNPSAAPLKQSEAIRLARDCYNALCDTDIFTFEEFTVSASFDPQAGQNGAYIVNMNSIYGNGCTFSVTLDARTRSVLAHSDPEQATLPTELLETSPEMQAWFTKNGPLLYTWSPEDQQEFSRRYEGGALRVARPGEISFEQAAQLAAQASKQTFQALDQTISSPACYPTLQNAPVHTDARYVVYCFPSAVTDQPLSPCIVVTMQTDGTIESVQPADPF